MNRESGRADADDFVVDEGLERDRVAVEGFVSMLTKRAR